MLLSKIVIVLVFFARQSACFCLRWPKVWISVCMLKAIIFIIISASQLVHAQNVTSVSPTSELQWSFGPEAVYTEYFEPGIMREEGILYGGRAFGQWDGKNNFVLRSDLGIAGGQLKYKGQDWSGAPRETRTQDFVTHFGIQAGYKVISVARYNVSVTLGSRLRYWEQVIDGSGGYPRELTQVFIPLGILIRHGDKSMSHVTYRVEYASMLYGQMHAKLSRATDDLGDQTLRQNQGKQMLFAFDWNSKRYLVGTYYKQTDVEKSKENKVRFNNQEFSLYEPQNRSTEVGLSAGLSF